MGRMGFASRFGGIPANCCTMKRVGIRRCCTSRGVLHTCGDDIMTHYHSPLKPGLDGFTRPALGILIPHVKDELSRRLIISEYWSSIYFQIFYPMVLKKAPFRYCLQIINKPCPIPQRTSSLPISPSSSTTLKPCTYVSRKTLMSG